MLESVNRRFTRNRNLQRDNAFILEAALDVDEVLPGSDDELDDIVDPDSVPEEVYNKIDKALDKYIESEDYDDSDVESLADGEDITEDDIDDGEIDTIITEAAGAWLDDENIGHPDTSRRGSRNTEQPDYDAEGSVIDGGGDPVIGGFDLD